jgi:hypothetical protein
MDTVQKIGGKGRRTRKLNTWAKAAGEYYREHKDEFKSFSEVLSSPKLREYYNAKYKNKKGGEGIENNITNNLVGGKKKRKSAKKRGGNSGISIMNPPLYGGEPSMLNGGISDGLSVSAPIAPRSTEEPIDPNATLPSTDVTIGEDVTTFGGKARKSSKKSKK